MPFSTVDPKIWTSLKDEFQKMFPQDTFDTWFAPLSLLEISEDALILSAPNDFAAIWVEENYLDLIQNKIRERMGATLRVSVQSGHEAVAEPVPEARPAHAANNRMADVNFGTANRARGSRMNDQAAHRQIFLSPRNTFENFIVGSSNQLAHAAALAVAHSPAKAYNPLFLYGETGLGKTHLMQAVAHHIIQANPDAHVVYVSCEKFTNEFITAIQENTLIDFRRYYRNVDALLIDDIQFLTGKERSQEEFFHTFNELFESQRQICFSSDRPASEISRLESRLVSRFQWGMVTDIQAPDLETRVAILRKKAQGQGHHLPDEVLEFMAQRITRNVRRMEGALTRVASYTTLTHQSLDIASVERLLHDILQEEAQNQITIEKIQKKVVEHYNLRQSDMVSRRRPANIAFPRQIAMYLCRILTTHALQEIGEAFGGRDHGTVIHACRTVENMMEQDETVKRNVEYLSKQLNGAA